ncbi:MAG TPA: alpha/beta fold hydrolase [Gemmatimonadales bacterium]|nr:alpha/beta fold hydrolase [Gemmatimonadales bacterium]
MATPTLTKHSIPGSLGPVLIDVRAAGRSSSRPAVVILHGFKGFKDWGMFPPLAERLARAGFHAVTFNFSGSGVDDSGDFTLSERFGHNTFSAEIEDTRSVLDALCRGDLGVAPPSSIGLVGHSRGGGIAILQTAHDSRIRALVTWSAIASVVRWPSDTRAAWRQTGMIEVPNVRTGQVLPLYTDVLHDIERNGAVLDIEAAAERIRIPWLLIHGTEDESVRFAEAELLKASSTIDTTRLLAVRGSHTFGATHPWQSGTPELDVVFDATASWLAANLT